MSNKELKPCPFCGGEADLNGITGDYAVICDECGSASLNYNTELEAIEAWNKRNYNKECCEKSCKEENATCKKSLQFTRSDIECLVKPIKWDGLRGKLEAFLFSINENRTTAFEVYFGKDWLDGHYIDTSSTIDGAKSLAQAFLVDLICSVLSVEE